MQTLDRTQFDFLPQLTASLLKLAGDPTQSSGSISTDSMRADSAEMAEFRRAIDEAKEKVLAAKLYCATLPGMDLSREQQDVQLDACLTELEAKTTQLAKYKSLSIFQNASNEASTAAMSNASK
ncbi:hypothetical protein HDU77_011119 [Chytriomyces hyalinus]|nr:hypothetical protein HDU77_011119 [Chytriomyces hyalinus]